MILNISLQISGNTILKTLINCLEIGIVTTIGFNIYIFFKDKTFYKKALKYIRELLHIFLRFVENFRCCYYDIEKEKEKENLKNLEIKINEDLNKKL